MAIKKYETMAAYEAAEKPSAESQVSLVESTNEVMLDGVNVVTSEPTVGDVSFIDGEGNAVFVKAAGLNPSLLPAGWTHVGYVYFRHGSSVGVVHKAYTAQKYVDVAQFEWTSTQTQEPFVLDGAAHTKSFGLTFGDMSSQTEFVFNYQASSLSALAAQLTGRIESVLDGLDMTDEKSLWWAYEDDDRIIIQRDEVSNLNVANCSGVSFCTFGDMPMRGGMLRENNRFAGTRGILNIERASVAYSSGGRTPTEDVVVGGEDGNTSPVTLAAFTSSPYCSAVRAYYGTYDDYLRGEYLIRWPQKYGVFSLPDGATLSELYADMAVPLKGGGTKRKYPAMYQCASIGYGTGVFGAGHWHLMGILECCQLLNDEVVPLLRASMQEMGSNAFNPTLNGISWCAQLLNRTGVNAMVNNGNFSQYGWVYNTQSIAVSKVEL